MPMPAASGWPTAIDAVVTSPPYPGLIDYHEQHRYAYELLGLDGPPRARAGRGAPQARPGGRSPPTCDGIAEALAHTRRAPAPRRPGRGRRQRPPRPLRATSPPGPGCRLGRAGTPARQPPHRPPRRRVLRGRALARSDQVVADDRAELRAARVVGRPSPVGGDGDRHDHGGQDEQAEASRTAADGGGGVVMHASCIGRDKLLL